MNVLTFDIEEWYIYKVFRGDDKSKYMEYDRILDHILELLDRNNTSATFFCLGKIASDFPHIVRKIASHGHEVGSHSNLHKWVNKMTPEEFKRDTHDAVAALEDLIGTKVTSFRAPAFSIGESNKWAIEILAENGIENDASIFPGVRDFGGFPSFTSQHPCIIQYKDSQITEFPIPLYKLPVLGKELAYSGGGYFRLLPLRFVLREMARRDYSMCYFHIGDLLTEKNKFLSKREFEDYFKESGSFLKRFSRYAKSNVGRKNALQNLDELVNTNQFVSIQQYIHQNPIHNKIII